MHMWLRHETWYDSNKKAPCFPTIGWLFHGKSVWNAPKNVRLRTAIEILMVKAPDVRWKFVSGFYSKLNVWRILTRDWDTKNHKDIFVSVNAHVYICVYVNVIMFLCTTQKKWQPFRQFFWTRINGQSWELISHWRWILGYKLLISREFGNLTSHLIFFSGG